MNREGSRVPGRERAGIERKGRPGGSIAALVALLLMAAVSVMAAEAEPTESSTDHESTARGAPKDVASTQPATAVAEAPSDAEGADDGATVRDRTQVQQMIYDRVMVIGNQANVERLPGSGHIVPLAELEKHHYNDLHRILRQVPGVNIQEEDGFGLRPNIGIRGTGVERSQKITLMEDGVLIAPAPYAAPAAYYSPTAGRMESIEVRKGSASIKQGPLTQGGAINMVSTSIPQDLGGKIDLSFGDFSTGTLHGSYGGSFDRFGFVLETYQQQTDGFKDLDSGGNSGFELADYLLKLRYNTPVEARFYQALELKLGRTDQLGDETYLGLTRDDFARAPYRRYAASALDQIDADHEQIQLRHFLQLRPKVDLTTTVYRNDTFRNWFKNEATSGISNGSIVSDPQRFATQLAYLRGELDSPEDTFTLRNNRRDYTAQGIQSVLGWRFASRGLDHQLEFGVRYHEDEEDRFQEDDLFAIRAGRMVLTSEGRPGSQANRIGKAEALAFFAQDQISIGKWTLTPGVRYELIDTARLDYGRNDPQRTGSALAIRTNDIAAVIPGLGVTYQLEPGWVLVGGVHRGFAPPSPSSREPVEEERSVNYEFGTRYSRGQLALELMGFFNDYDNLLGADTASGGGQGTGDLFNGGAVQVQGIETGFSTDLLARSSAAVWRMPLRVNYTFTEGEFQSSFLTGFADWSPEVLVGDKLPYLPQHQIFAQLGLERDAWRVSLGASYVDAMRTKAGQGPIPEDERIEDHVVFDLGGEVELFDRFRVYLQVRNLSDEVYVAANRPYGLRPGMARMALVGLSFNF